jgi:hypothetical protein
VASQERWEKMEGSFNLTTLPRRLVFYLEGPPPGVDLLIDSVTISYKVLQWISCLLVVYNCSMALEKEGSLSAETISENMSYLFDHPEHVQELLLTLKTACI